MTSRPALHAAIVGAQKSGTTALAEFLDTHPRLALPRGKELHAFDDEDHDWDDPDLAALLADRFDGARPGALRVDATPITMYWPHAVERMVACVPQVRAIVLLRDPVDRAWSHWRMERARGNETLDFATAIRAGRERVRAAGGHHRVFSYVERGFYAQQLDRLRRALPDEQVLVLRQADLLGAHEATLRRVHAFLGVPRQTPLPRHRIVHGQGAGPGMDRGDRRFLRGVYAAELDRLARDHGVELRPGRLRNLWHRVRGSRRQG